MTNPPPPGVDLTDPELIPLLESFPGWDLAVENLPAIRAAGAAALRALPVPEGAPLAEEVFAPGPRGPVRVLVWRTPGAAGPLPAVLQIHGGGYIMGLPEMGAATHRDLVAAHPCAVFSVDYGLAPEVPHPGPVEDCYAVLKWMVANAAGLGIDPARIGVNGISAGGGLAAALCLLARDRGEVSLAFQHLIYPMLDDRTCTAADPHPHTGAHVWNPAANLFGWRALLGVEPGSPGVSPYAAPGRAEDLAGLPPAYISVGALDLFLEEDIEYARRLTRAGVPVELHVYPGAFHAFDRSEDAAVASQARRDNRAALIRMLGG